MIKNKFWLVLIGVFLQTIVWSQQKYWVFLTDKGQALKQTLACLPIELAKKVEFDEQKAHQLKNLLNELIMSLPR